MMANDVALNRVLKASAEKVYRAFTEVNAMATWINPYGFICTVQKMKLRVGGKYKMHFIISPTTAAYTSAENI